MLQKGFSICRSGFQTDVLYKCSKWVDRVEALMDSDDDDDGDNNNDNNNEKLLIIV